MFNFKKNEETKADAQSLKATNPLEVKGHPATNQSFSQAKAKEVDGTKPVLKVIRTSDFVPFPQKTNPDHSGFAIHAIDYSYSSSIDGYIYNTGIKFLIPEGYRLVIHPSNSLKKSNWYMPDGVTLLHRHNTEEFVIVFKCRIVGNQIPPYVCGDVIAKAYLEKIQDFDIEEIIIKD